MHYQFLHPKFYFTWLGLFFMWCLSYVHIKGQILVACLLGKMLYLFWHKRRRTAYINVTLCFPDKTKIKQSELVKSSFTSLAMGIIATANSFYMSGERFKKCYIVRGNKHLQVALKLNQPIIFLTGHFTALMCGARALSEEQRLAGKKIAGIYRPQNNTLFNHVMNYHFTRHGVKTIMAKNIKSVIKTLKSGLSIWYAPDQDLGTKNSVFVPFFGIKTAMITTTSKLSKITKATVLPMVFFWQDNTYVLEFSEHLTHYPSDDITKDTKRTSALLEAKIRQIPSQYLWIHKRFKTRPKGESSPYK